jgi:hypothetical protein
MFSLTAASIVGFWRINPQKTNGIFSIGKRLHIDGISINDFGNAPYDIHEFKTFIEN